MTDDPTAKPPTPEPGSRPKEGDAPTHATADGPREENAEPESARPEAPAKPAKPTPPAPVTRPSSGGGRGWLWLLVVIVMVAVLAAGGWYGWRWARQYDAAVQGRLDALQRDLDASTKQSERLQTRLSDQSVVVQRAAGEVAKVIERVDAQDEALGQVRAQIGGGRARVQLALVEQLLMLANDRLQVGREVDGALTALDAADSRLVSLKEPRLFPVREAIAQERAELQAVPLPDTDGAALTLSSLIGRVPRLALAAQTPERKTADVAADDSAPADGGGWQRLWMGIRQAVGSVFTIRRSDGPPPKLLSEAQESLVRQILGLRLESARLALLRRDTPVFRDACAASIDWLDSYFHTTDPAVAAVRSELVRLQGLQLNPPLPDISRSLTLLRAQMDAQADARPDTPATSQQDAPAP